MAATLVVLFVAERCGIVSFPRFERSLPRRIFPLPIFYLLNLVSGLGGTQKLNLPMFTVLRRISILMTMILGLFSCFWHLRSHQTLIESCKTNNYCRMASHWVSAIFVRVGR